MWAVYEQYSNNTGLSDIVLTSITDLREQQSKTGFYPVSGIIQQFSKAYDGQSFSVF